MTQNLTDNWQMDGILTDNWYLQPPTQTLLQVNGKCEQNRCCLVSFVLSLLSLVR